MKQCTDCIRLNAPRAIKCSYCHQSNLKDISITAESPFPHYKLSIDTIVIENVSYKIDGLINRGGFATVLRLSDANGCLYALKVPWLFDNVCSNNTGHSIKDIEDSSKVLKRDISNINRLNAATILNVISTGDITLDHKNTSITFPYILMEYAPTTLYRLISAESQGDIFITFPDKLKIIRDFILSLKSLHDNNFLHRDLSPNNIFCVDRNNEISFVLSDFGSAKNIITETTRSRDILAKPQYLDPHIRLDPNFISDPRRDLYSAGLIIAEILFGDFWKNVNPFITDYDHLNIVTDVLDMSLKQDIDPALYSIIVKMVNPDISQRYPNINYVLDDLLKYIDQIPSNALQTIHLSGFHFLQFSLKVPLPIDLSDIHRDYDVTILNDFQLPQMMNFANCKISFPNILIEKVELRGSKLFSVDYSNNQCFLIFNEKYFKQVYKSYIRQLKGSHGYLRYQFYLFIKYSKL